MSQKEKKIIFLIKKDKINWDKIFLNRLERFEDIIKKRVLYDTQKVFIKTAKKMKAYILIHHHQ